MIGQKNNKAYLSSLSELPHFTVVLGPKGSGRRTLLGEEFSSRGIPLTEVDGKVDSLREAVSMAFQRGGRNAFLLDSADFSANSAGTLLKVAEDTPNGSWFALIAESRSSVYPTLLSRALVIEMEPYSSDDFAEYAKSLSRFGVSVEEALSLSSYCRTFGDMFSMASLPDHGASLIAFAEKVMNNILSVPTHNALMIPSYLALRNEAGKFRPDLFLNAVSGMVECLPAGESSIRMAKATAKARSLMSNKGLNKQMVMDEWVMSMRGEKGWN